MAIAMSAGGCASWLDESNPTKIASIYILAGEEEYVKLNDAQRAAVDTLRQEFPDRDAYPTYKLIRWATAENPGLFKNPGEQNLADYRRALSAARAEVSANAMIAATQPKLSAQASVGMPSQDANANPTVFDARRNETGNGHPQY